MIGRKIYVLEGCTWEPSRLHLYQLENMLFTDCEKANNELERILNDIEEKAEAIGQKVDIQWYRDRNIMEVKYPNGRIDHYTILRRTIM